MEIFDQILESLYDRVIEPCEAKQQIINLFGITSTVCEHYREGKPTTCDKCYEKEDVTSKLTYNNF